MRPLKLALLAALALSLGSCQLGYDIELSVRGGKLLLTFAQQGWGQGKGPVEVEWLTIRELSATPRDIWQLRSVDYNGRSLKTIAYGAVPSQMTEEIKPEPLRIGQYYRVELKALGGGGSEEFMISPEAENGQLNRVTIVREPAKPSG